MKQVIHMPELTPAKW